MIRRALLVGSGVLGGGESTPALVFNGSTTSVDCGSDASLDDLHDAIICVDGWFKSGDANEGVIIGKGAFHNSTGGWGVFLSGTGALGFRVSCTTTSTLASATGKNDNAWHHFVGFFNDAGGADRKAYLAVDGVWSAAGGLAVDAILTDAATNLKMGVLPTVAAWLLNGRIGWMRISNNDRFNHGVDFTGSIPSRTEYPTVDANTIEQWNVDEGSGTTLTAQVTSPANNGTIANGTWGI